MCNFVGAVFTVFWCSFPDAEKGDVVSHQQWVHGVGVGKLLLARVMVFESPNEEDQRCTEVVVFGYCKKKRNVAAESQEHGWEKNKESSLQLCCRSGGSVQGRIGSRVATE